MAQIEPISTFFIVKMLVAFLQIGSAMAICAMLWLCLVAIRSVTHALHNVYMQLQQFMPLMIEIKDKVNVLKVLVEIMATPELLQS